MRPVVRFAFAGERGSFAEDAVHAYAAQAALPSAEPVPLPDFRAVASDVARAGGGVETARLDAGVLPIENLVAGTVAEVYDLLLAHPLVIVGEVVVPVRLCLAALPGERLESIERVYSHSQALGQAEEFLRSRPWALLTTYNTAGSGRMIAERGERRAAAVLSPRAAALFGLEVLARDIGDVRDAETRFVLLARPAQDGDAALPALPAPTGADKTSLVAFLRADHPGALVEVLEQFVTRGINLSRIESRPTGDALGRYCFSIDCEGHVAEARVGEALMGLHRVCEQVRFLGSYPQARGKPPLTGTGPGEEAFAAAEGWLRRLRAGMAG